MSSDGRFWVSPEAQNTLTESTPTPNSPILTDTWTPVDASISFTSSSKLSRGGFGHLADFFCRPIKGNAVEGSVLLKTITFKQPATVTTTTSRTQTGTASIRVTSTKTQTGVARINLVTAKTQTGIADILRTTPQTQSGVSRIQLVTSRPQSGVSRIQLLTSRTISGTADIQGTTTRTQTGTADIQNRTIRTQTGAADIQVTTPQNQSGVAHLVYQNSQIQTGVATILGTTHRTQAGIANIHPATSDVTQTGKAFIHPASSLRIQYGVANINPATANKTITGVANIIALGDVRQYQTGIANIQAETSSPTSPGGLISSLSGSCVVLTWTAATDAIAVTSYLIYRAVTGFSFTFLASVSGSVLTFTDCSVSSGSYDFYVVAQNGGGITGPASGTVTQVVTITSTQAQSGVANINGAQVRNQTGVSNIVSATPSLGVRVTQLPVIVNRHLVGASDGSGNSVNVSQVAAIAAIKPDHTEVRVPQICLIVRVPYVPRVCWGYSSDNYGLGGAPL